MMRQLAFFFDASVCSGCKTCQMACKDKHDLEKGRLWRRVYEISGGGWEKKENLWSPGVFVYNLSISCFHCEDPLCRKSCPTKAISKREDGIVSINQDKCVGCRYCEWACPYGSPQYDKKTGTMSKCHFCFDLLDQGGLPVCVTACPMRALDCGDLSALRQKYPGVNQVFPLPDPSFTGPSVVIYPHRDSARAEKEKGRVSNIEEVK